MSGFSERADANRLEKKQILFRSALLVLITLGVYWPVYRAGLIWDDAVMLTDNPLIKSSDGLRWIWFSTKSADYFPLTLTSFWLEWRLWGEWYGGYHLTNVLLHACDAILFWRVLVRLRIPAAWMCAAVFALHPVCVASVAWIAERKNTLSLVFYLLTILYYLRSREDSGVKPYIYSLTFFLLALLSKTSVVMLPFVLLFCEWWQREGKGGLLDARSVLRIVPYLTMSVVLGLVTVWFQAHRAIGDSSTINDPLWTRLLAGSWATWFYIWKGLVPWKLSMIYSQWEIDTRNIMSYVPALAWIGVLAFLWLKRARWSHVCLFALSCFLLNLAPVLGFFKMFYFNYSRVADHWQYLSLLALVALVVGGIAAVLPRTIPPTLRAAACAMLLGLLGSLTWKQASVYQNAETLWFDTLQKNPKAWMAHNNLGVELEKRGADDEAMMHFEQALLLRPGNADAHFNIGKSFDLRGQKAEARQHYEQALAFEPNYIKAHNNLAMILESSGNSAAAETHYRAALQAAPNYTVAHNNLSQLLLKQGKIAEAYSHAREAIELNPDFPQAHYNLGNVFALQGKDEEAAAHFNRAIELSPDYAEAHFNLANLLAKNGKLEEARRHYERAMQIRPGFVDAQAGFGHVLLQQGKVKDAELAFRRVVELDSGHSEAQNQLGLVLLKQGRRSDAIEHFEAALKASPRFSEAHYNFGNLLLAEGKLNEAARHYEAALNANGDYPEAHYQLAMLLLSTRQAAAAISHLREAVRLRPDWREAINNLSWLLATHADPKLRNGQEAVVLATKAKRLTNGEKFEPLDTLAAAYAEAGQYSNAVVAAQSALQMASKISPQAAEEIRGRLRLYEAGQPFREDLNGKK